MSDERKKGRSARPGLIERTRRAQIVDVTIDLVAQHGYAGVSLQRIADGAAITKAAVLYYFPSKDAAVLAARDAVFGRLVADVGASVDAALAESGAGAAPAAYIRGMVGHFRETPRHARMIIEAGMHEQAATGGAGDAAPGGAGEAEAGGGVDAGVEGTAAIASAARWAPLAELLRDARDSRAGSGAPAEADADARAAGTAGAATSPSPADSVPPELRALALIVGGGIDAIVMERLADPGFDTDGAAELLIRLADGALGGS